MTDLTRADFIGRRLELDRLDRAYADAATGCPQVVLVCGDAGIGKTALVRRFLAQLDRSNWLEMSGDVGETSVSYGVLRQVGLHPPRPAEPAQRPGPVVPDPVAAGEMLVERLGELQLSGPVVLVLDDAHWADVPSLRTLAFALRRLRVDRVLAVIAVRDDSDPHLPDGLRRQLADDTTIRLRLAGLAAPELRQMSGTMCAGELSPSAVTRLHRHTEGHPLHARMLLEQLPLDVLDDVGVPLPAPRSFAQLVLARLAACDLEARRLIVAAAVLGTSGALSRVAEVAEVDDPLHALEGAIAAGLLAEQHEPYVIDIPHPLTRTAIYQAIGPFQRSALHARTAAASTREHQVLRHRALASTGPEPRLVLALTGLAHQEIHGGEWTDAAESLMGAARLSPRADEQDALLLEATDCLILAGDVCGYSGLAARVQDLPPTSQRSYVLARLRFVTGNLCEAEELLEDAWARTDAASEPGLAARIASQIALLRVFQGDGAGATDWGNRALRLIPDPSAVELSRYIPLVGLGMVGRADEALRSLHSLPPVAVASASERDAVLARARLRMWTDDLIGAHDDLSALTDGCRSGSIAFRLLATTMLGEVEFRLGRWDDSIASCEAAVSLADDAENATIAPYCHAVAAMVPAARGQFTSANAHVEAARQGIVRGHVAAQAYASAAAACVAHAGGKPDEVVAALGPLLDRRSSDGAFEPGLLHWQELLVEALVSLGELEAARLVLEPFEATATNRCRRSSLALAARARGSLLAAAGDSAGAVDAFASAVERAAALDMPFVKALNQLARGAFLRRLGRRREAAAPLGAAEATFSRLGAQPYLERCQRELAACGRTPGPLAARRWDALTPQELAVTRLVAKGLTNRQVARELVVSIKTVEYHLGHVFAKLGITSRTRLSALYNSS